MFMLSQVPRDPDLEPVWNGAMKGIYLTALRNLSAFVARIAQGEPEPEIPVPVIGRVIEHFRRARGPLTVTDVAIPLHLSGRTAARIVQELTEVGVLSRLQPSLFELHSQREELYVIRGED
jgi:hypothetical protein